MEEGGTQSLPHYADEYRIGSGNAKVTWSNHRKHKGVCKHDRGGEVLFRTAYYECGATHIQDSLLQEDAAVVGLESFRLPCPPIFSPHIYVSCSQCFL